MLFIVKVHAIIDQGVHEEIAVLHHTVDASLEAAWDL